MGNNGVDRLIFAVYLGHSGDGIQQIVQLFYQGGIILLSQSPDSRELVAQIVALLLQVCHVFHHQLIVLFLFGDLCFHQMGLKAQLFLENGLLLDSLQSAQQHPVDHHHAQQQAGSCQDELSSPR